MLTRSAGVVPASSTSIASVLPPRAAILIGVVKDDAEAELARIKYWKDPALLRLTELYRARIGT